MGHKQTTFTQELILYVISAEASCLVLFAGLKQLNHNKATAKKAADRKKEIAKKLGRPFVRTNQYEDVIACDVVNPDDIDVTFESIGGLDEIKQALHELVILPLQRPGLFSHGRLLGPQKGVLLYGPPGTEKTLLAKAIAKRVRSCFYQCSNSKSHEQLVACRSQGTYLYFGSWSLARLSVLSGRDEPGITFIKNKRRKVSS